jgi:dihydropteroate synthase
MSHSLDFTKPIIMGILNVTPDSFSDGGSYPSSKSAVDKAMIMVEQGASIIDIGGESTRPGSERVSPIEQKRRIIDVISQLRTNLPEGVIISVDTTSSEVAEAGNKPWR